MPISLQIQFIANNRTLLTFIMNIKQAIILIFLKLVSVQAVKIVQVGGNGWESYFKHIS